MPLREDQAASPAQRPSFERIARAAKESLEYIAHGKIALRDRALTLIDKADDYLEKKIPLLPHQKIIDELTATIQRKFAPLSAFNAWVYSNGGGAWYRELATFLYKLPLRAAMNIVNLLYDVIKESLRFTVHPAKSALRLARLCICLLDALTTPETWALVGAGMIGNSCGCSLVTLTPLSLIGAAIGGALCIGGISISALVQALRAQPENRAESVKVLLLQLTKQSVEAAVTGFFMGLIAGGVQRALHSGETRSIPIGQEDLQKYVSEFLKQNNLPNCSSFYIENGEIFIVWKEIGSGVYFHGLPLWGMFHVGESTNISYVLRIGKSIQEADVTCYCRMCGESISRSLPLRRFFLGSPPQNPIQQVPIPVPAIDHTTQLATAFVGCSGMGSQTKN